MVIRQAHPGPGAEAYHSFVEKLDDAERYRREEQIPWPVLVDDLAGTTHQLYGGLADPVYLIDREGRVAFYNMWAHAPSLHEALVELKRQDGRGVVKGGIDPAPHALAALTNGWKGLRKGLPQSFLDLESAAPTSGMMTWLGYQVRGLLAPLTLRAEPLPPTVKLGLALAAAAFALKVCTVLQHDSNASTTTQSARKVTPSSNTHRHRDFRSVTSRDKKQREQQWSQYRTEQSPHPLAHLPAYTNIG